MSPQGRFMICCTEYSVWDYLYSCFDALHTTGMNYIVDDIDQYIAERQAS